jgi:hypothetical protein
LDEALAAARLHRCPLIVSRVDRLTRSVSFLSKARREARWLPRHHAHSTIERKG